MKDLDDFYPQILPWAPGCPEPTVRNAIVQACITFCERTRLWRAEDSFGVTADLNTFVCVPSTAQLIEIEQATFNDEPLDPIALRELNYRIPQWRTDTSTQPRYVTQVAPDTVQVVPTATGTLKLYMTLKPADEAEQVPDFLVDKHRRLIAAGALTDILMLPGQPFTNPDLAAAYNGRWQSRLDSLFNQNIKGQQRAKARVRPSFF